MSALTFVIPTRGRARQLSAAVRSIAEQIGTSDVRVVVLYNNGEADTERAIARASSTWNTVESVGVDGSPDYAQKFRTMFRVASESEWVWTFGDDDKLEPGALKFMLERLAKADPALSFIHVSERKRSTGSGHTFTGRLIELACTIGWIEMTGFITGNITRGRLLAKCAESPNWGVYSENSFAHSCAILETLKYEQAQFIDLPLVDSQDQVQSPELLDQWVKDKAGERYFYIGNALQTMMDQGILPKKLPAKFFRYLHYHLWDRHISYFLSNAMSGAIWDDDWIDHVSDLSYMVDDYEMGESIRCDLYDAVELAKDRKQAEQRFNLNSEKMTALYKKRSGLVYSEEYNEPPKKEAA